MATVTKGRTFVSGETVTPAKLNELVDSATVTAIQTADISDSQITTAKIADANVTTAKIADSNVTAAKLASGSVETAKINNAAVTAAKLDGAQPGSAPIYGCRAWVNFDGTTVNGSNECTIRGSANVTKVVRTATGAYTVYFTTAMPDANYAVLFGSTVGSNGQQITLPAISSTTAPTDSQLAVESYPTGGGVGGLANSSRFTLSVIR